MHASEAVGLIRSGGVNRDIRPEDLGPARDLPSWATPGIVAAARKAFQMETPFALLVPHLEKVAGAAMGEHIITEYTPVSDQTIYQACVANAACDLMEMLRGLEDPTTVVQLARMFVWWLCRWTQGTPGQNIGTSNQVAMYVLVTAGICPEDMYPYRADNAYDEPTLDCFTVARVNRLTAFSRVGDDPVTRVDELELSVRADHPFLFSTGWSQACSDWKQGDAALVPEEDIKGLHDLIGAGVRGSAPDREFWIRNSYGLGYGDQGHCWFHESYLTAAYSRDFYVGTRMPSLRLG